MPSNTPGTKKGNQSAPSSGQRQVKSAAATTSVAVAAAYPTECGAAHGPAAMAGQKSRHVRALETNW